ncbi:MAG: hypothetical protein CME63_13825 [Halobacteriovoraceae bacterium]|jgi:hypothetical protein|nr:hypothetical protein [Halobacteriovoraceae bacterium]MBC98821.1 hypothetical protein [Halobacteriovoraceae bacterium]
MKSLLFAMTLVLTFSSFGQNLNISEDQGYYDSTQDFCAQTYLEAFLELEDISETFNKDVYYTDAEFIADYTGHSGKLKIRNTSCKFKLTKKEKRDIQDCNHALKNIYDDLSDRISITRTIFGGSSSVEEIDMPSKWKTRALLVKATAICAADGIILDI